MNCPKCGGPLGTAGVCYQCGYNAKRAAIEGMTFTSSEDRAMLALESIAESLKVLSSEPTLAILQCIDDSLTSLASSARDIEAKLPSKRELLAAICFNGLASNPRVEINPSTGELLGNADAIIAACKETKSE